MAGNSEIRVTVVDGRDTHSVLLRSVQATAKDVAKGLSGESAAQPIVAFRNGSFVVPLSAPLAFPWFNEGQTLHTIRPHTKFSSSNAVELRVIGGPGAGLAHPLPNQSTTLLLGRDTARCPLWLPSPSVSALHAELVVGGIGEYRIRDLHSANGVAVGGVPIEPGGETVVPMGVPVDVGACRFVLEETVVPSHGLGPIAPDATRPFHRPPKPRRAAAATPIEIPVLPSLPDGSPRFSWTALLIPLGMGLMMAALFSPTMALFALLGPVMAIGTYAEDRRRMRKSRADAEATRGALHDALRASLQEATQAERQRRIESILDPGRRLAVSRAAGARLWERRLRDGDALNVHIGFGQRHWDPPILGNATIGPEFVDIVTNVALPDVPISIPFEPGSAVGIVGDRDCARALGSSMLSELASALGPSELHLGVGAVLTTQAAMESWSWATLLPHAQLPDAAAGSIAFAYDRASCDELLVEEDRSMRAIEAQSAASASARTGPLGEAAPPKFLRLLVVEVEALSDAGRALLRKLLDTQRTNGHVVCALILASRADELPDSCRSIISIMDPIHGIADVHSAAFDVDLIDVMIPMVPPQAAEAAARSLCTLRDPETSSAGASLPERVALLDALGLTSDLSTTSIAQRWAAHWPKVGTQLEVTVGVGESGPFAVDFVTDGPHALMGGTTGSGKSELLRSLVASLAASYPPTHLNFVLVDYKGGSAFDACAALPHTVGLVTDLDESLGERALISLEAELRYREMTLRNAGVGDLRAYLDLANQPTTTRPPLPRLMVIIDEFATMAAELPDFLAALVGVAQRGRSLGVHLVLATQRPNGAINDNIRANTNLRIALRVQDLNDSLDILGSGAAATISRRVPGRAFARLGPGETVAFQTGRIPTAESMPKSPQTEATGTASDVATQVGLDALVDVIVAAWSQQSATALPLRRPWLDPLPDSLSLADLALARWITDDSPNPNAGLGSAVAAAESFEIAIGLADHPDQQSQPAYRWAPAHGNVAVVGLQSSGAPQTLVTVAAQLCAYPPDRMHLYGLDFGDGRLRIIRTLNNVGDVVASGERERLGRLLRMLTEIVDDRRLVDASDGNPQTQPRPQVVVLVDGCGGLLSALDELSITARDEFARIVADGPALGVVFWIAADRPGSISLPILGATPLKLVFRLADPSDGSQFGVDRKHLPNDGIGRAIAMPSQRTVQIAVVSPSEVEQIGQSSTRATGSLAPRSVLSLPSDIRADLLVDAANFDDDETWTIPVGLSDETLQAVGFELREGEHALITGPGHSGKSTMLQSLAQIANAHGVGVVTCCPRPSPLAKSPFVDRVVASSDLRDVIETLGMHQHDKVLLLIDDAELIDDDSGALAEVLGRRLSNVRIVVAGRADVLRNKFGHWTAEIRRSRSGFVLRPVLDLDGDLWFTTLPRRGPAKFRDGYGYLVNYGTPQLVQAAQPTSTT